MTDTKTLLQQVERAANAKIEQERWRYGALGIAFHIAQNQFNTIATNLDYDALAAILRACGDYTPKQVEAALKLADHMANDRGVDGEVDLLTDFIRAAKETDK